MPKVSVTNSGDWITDPQKLEAIDRRIRECIEDPEADDSMVETLTNLLEFVESRRCFSKKQLDFLSKIEELIETRASSLEYGDDRFDDLPF